MRWVAAGTLDRLAERSADLRADRDRWHEVAMATARDLVRERERYDRLVAEVLALRREGFTAPTTPVGPPPTTGEPEMPTVVRDAITERSAGQPSLRKLLEADAWAMLDAGHEPKDVALRILAGQEVEP